VVRLQGVGGHASTAKFGSDLECTVPRLLCHKTQASKLANVIYLFYKIIFNCKK
jgi:hypothetical protein